MLRWASASALLLGVAGCAAAEGDSSNGSAAASAQPAADSARIFDATRLHTLDIAMSDADFAATQAAYAADQTKKWVEASVTIDGTTYERCGVRLKGNSTIWQVPTGSSASEYPWLVRLDKYVDGQAHDGVTEIVVRLNRTASALNEAVSLDLLAKAGLASQPWSYAVVSVAGAAPVLRLIMEQPSDPWVAREFGVAGILYKAEATSNYDYLGDDPDLYAERFDVEAGEDDLTPLIAFLKWANEIDDAGFATGLGTRLDVPAFATYLALEELIDNYDAIEGPGNNSYLWWDRGGDQMTVVGWDHNLTFGVSNRPGGGGMGRGGRTRPGADGQLPQGGAPGGGMGGGATRGNQSGNVLARRFRANTEFAGQVSAASTRLRADLFTSGYAAGRLDASAAVLRDQAGNYLSDTTLASEKSSIGAYFD